MQLETRQSRREPRLKLIQKKIRTGKKKQNFPIINRERERPYDTTYMWNLRKWYKWTNETEADSQTWKMNLRVREDRDSPGVWDGCVPTAIFKMENQQGPTVQPGEPCSRLCNNVNGKIIWKNIYTYICLTESLCCTPETNTTLLINSTPT